MSQPSTPTLRDQRYRLASGATTAVELTERALADIAASQPTLNAFTAVLTESALSDAAEADRRRARGDTAPLLGIPIAISDGIEVFGTPTTFGASPVLGPASSDAEVVRRLRAAGAVIVGKTGAGDIGMELASFHGQGDIRNPWHRNRSPGIGCGGAAAAVSAGLVSGAVGTDTVGGLRISASWTNLVAIKPQRGRISTWPMPEAFHGLTSYGVLARTVNDAAVLLDAASGNVGGDLHRPAPVRVSDYVGIAPGELTIAVSGRNPLPGRLLSDTDPQIEPAMWHIGGVLESLGHTVVSGGADYGLGLWRDYVIRLAAGLWEWADRLGGIGTIGDPRIRVDARAGMVLSQAELRKARRREAHAGSYIAKVFDHVDVLVTPTTVVPAPDIDGADAVRANTLRGITAVSPETWAWNVLGWPAISVPAGFTSDGMPIGIQLLGPPDSEPMLVSLASQLKAMTGYAARSPQRWWAAAGGESVNDQHPIRERDLIRNG